MLEASGDDERVTIVVQDTGPGIAAEDITPAVRPFVQVGGSGTQNREGTGLGLVISQYLAYAMGGAISVESTLGAGSRFELELPRRFAGTATSPTPESIASCCRRRDPGLAGRAPGSTLAAPSLTYLTKK